MTMHEVNREEVEATKLAVRRLDVHNISSRRTLVKCVRIMRELYLNDGTIGYLHAAIARIQAYLELGFCYDDEKDLFDEILDLSGTSKIEQFPRRTYAAKHLLATHAQVAGVIKRWYGVKGNTFTKDQLVNDILDKVTNLRIGVYEYSSSNESKSTTGSKGSFYILYIEEEEQLLYDAERDVFYTFGS